jgi:hypothetical protein
MLSLVMNGCYNLAVVVYHSYLDGQALGLEGCLQLCPTSSSWYRYVSAQ